MLIPRFVVLMFSAGMVVLGAGVVSAQDFPNKPVRIVAGAAGGGSDFTARLIAQGLTASFGHQQVVIVENRGGSPAIAGETVAKATPDGYTLLLGTNSLWILQLIQNTPYDTLRDFSPLTIASRSPNILVVHPSLPVKSVKELIALAKAKPGALSYASGPVGSAPHLAPELFKAMAGVDIVRIGYKGGAPALNGLIGGEAQLMFAVASGGVMTTFVKSGRLRALAVTTAQPSELAPGLPTVAASGLPGYESDTIAGMLAPARTPARLINRLNQEIVRVLNRADVKERLFNVGTEVVSGSPAEFAAVLKSEMAKWGKVIKDAGIRAD